MADIELRAVSNDTHFENVLAYYMSKKGTEAERFAALSEKDRELEQRWKAAWMMVLEVGSKEKAVRKLVKVLKISAATAYRDIDTSEMLFGSFKRFDKEARRYVQIERKYNLYDLAIKQGKLELASKIDADIDKLLGLDKDDSPIDLDKIASQNYDVIISNKQSRLLKMIHAQGGFVNMNVPDTIDIDFEVLKGNSQDEQ